MLWVVVTASEAQGLCWCHAGLEQEVHAGLLCPPDMMVGHRPSTAKNKSCCWGGFSMQLTGIFDSKMLVVHLSSAMIKVLKMQLSFSRAKLYLFAAGFCLL